MGLSSPTEQQSRVIWFALTGLAMAAVIALMVAGVWGLAKILKLLSPVLWPLAIAGVLACLLSPVVGFFESRKVPRSRAVLLVFVIAFTLMTGVLVSVIPIVIGETAQLAAEVPKYSQSLQTRVNNFTAHPPEFLSYFLPKSQTDASGCLPTALASVTDWLSSCLPAMGTWLLRRLAGLTSSFGLVAGMALIPIYAFHFLSERRGMETHWKEYLPVRNAHAKDEIVFMLESIGQYLVAFFRGQLFVAICNAVLYTVGFLAVGVNYAFLIGFIALFLTMIPFLGSIVVCITALTLAFVQYADWQHPALVLGVFAVVQLLESVVIGPKIMGDRVGLHPLVIIIAVMTGTTLLGGILGGMLAIPFAAALRVILARYAWKKGVV